MYNRFDVSRDGPGRVVVVLSRAPFCPTPPQELPGEMTVRIGPIGVGPDKQPAIAAVTGTLTRFVPACTQREFVFDAPLVPWRIEIEGETFVPKEVDPNGSSDARHLAARPSFTFIPDG